MSITSICRISKVFFPSLRLFPDWNKRYNKFCPCWDFGERWRRLSNFVKCGSLYFEGVWSGVVTQSPVLTQQQSIPFPICILRHTTYFGV